MRLGIGCFQLGKVDLLSALVQLLAFEDGIHPLDRADTDLGIGRDVGGFQTAHAVKLREGSGIVIRCIGEKLALRLLAEALGIDEEQDAVHPAVFQQAVCRCDRGKGFARAGRHLHERLGAVLGKGAVKILDRVDLALAETALIERRKMLHVVADGIVCFV